MVEIAIFLRLIKNDHFRTILGKIYYFWLENDEFDGELSSKIPGFNNDRQRSERQKALENYDFRTENGNFSLDNDEFLNSTTAAALLPAKTPPTKREDFYSTIEEEMNLKMNCEI
uniref:Uncharacterized protein n=1 Tax=Romanomermis culicivorax TaxID=13658 RepID=A0A915L506_ROMCU